MRNIFENRFGFTRERATNLFDKITSRRYRK